ncbi:MAG: inner membrane protein [Crocinitomicaceae bacterium]|jgi:inner membrane protein
MDSLTQIVLGAAVGEAVLGRKIGSRAMLWGAVAGTIPDLDVFIRYFTDDITATEMHRGFSHSLVFSVLMAPILAWVANKIHGKREIGIKPWAWLFFLALVTHPLLDNHTTWGTQFFWPFEYRIAFKNIFVVDPIYTVPFLIFTLIAMFHKRTNPRRRKFNNIGLIVSSSYMVLTILFKGITFVKFDNQLEKDKIEYVDMDTRPAPLNTILWNAQVETKTGYRVAYYSFFDSKDIKFSEEIPKNYHLIAPYKDQKIVKQLIKISAGWYVIREEEGQLYFVDLRFGQLGFNDDSKFMWQYKLTPDKNGKIAAERLPPNFDSAGGMFGEMWDRIGGN